MGYETETNESFRVLIFPELFFRIPKQSVLKYYNKKNIFRGFEDE